MTDDRTSGEIARDLAEAHVTWFLETLRPLLKMHMEHGFKHGVEWVESRKEDVK